MPARGRVRELFLKLLPWHHRDIEEPVSPGDFEPKPVTLHPGELPAARYIVPLVRFDLSDPPAYEFTDEDLAYLLWRIEQGFYATPEQEGILIRCEEIADVGGLALPPRPGAG